MLEGPCCHRSPQGRAGGRICHPPQCRAVPLFPSRSRPASACPGIDLMGCNGNKNEAVLMGFLLF